MEASEQREQPYSQSGMVYGIIFGKGGGKHAAALRGPSENAK